jgi:hypothetical protein
MADPLTLTIVGAVVLTEGVKFLYGQAGEALKRRREQRDPRPAREPTSAVVAQVPPVFEEQFDSSAMDQDAVDRLESKLHEVRRELQDYVDGIAPIVLDDEQLLRSADQLRHLMEEIYGHRITFRGEQRSTEEFVPGTQGHASKVMDSGVVAGRDVRQRGRYVAGRDMTIGSSVEEEP